MGCNDSAKTSRAGSCAPGAGGKVSNACCGGRDLGPVGDHEGISEEDMERFSGVTRECPECRTEVYDEAELCHSCGHHFTAGDSSKGLPTWAVVALVVVVGVAVLGISLR